MEHPSAVVRPARWTAVIALLAALGVHAQSRTPPIGAAEALPRAGGDPPSLLGRLEPKRRWFVRIGAAGLKLNDASTEVRDLDGPVLHSSDHPILPLLAPGVDAFGTPDGVSVDVRNSVSLFGSIGKFLDDHWAIEGLVLALPFKHDIHGAGTIARLGKVATVKQLPPTLILHYYFNDFDAKFRPSIGIGLNYTKFFEAKATPALEAYTGGRTRIKMKPSWGLGLFAGAQYRINERLHVKLTVGYVRVRTTATMTTTDTMLSGTSPVLSDYPYPVSQIPTDPVAREAMDNLIDQVATERGGSLGTFKREIRSKLDPYVVLLSVGYSF
jgi:outer membrane protein